MQDATFKTFAGQVLATVEVSMYYFTTSPVLLACTDTPELPLLMVLYVPHACHMYMYMTCGCMYMHTQAVVPVNCYIMQWIS